jgi:disulfide bond formation protein DsbB
MSTLRRRFGILQIGAGAGLLIFGFINGLSEMLTIIALLLMLIGAVTDAYLEKRSANRDALP